MTIGRSLSADVVLSWDEDVSRIHTELRRMGVEWVLVDEGLSRNGSFVNGERVEGRRLLDDGDELRFGQTLLRYRAPFQVVRAHPGGDRARSRGWVGSARDERAERTRAR